MSDKLNLTQSSVNYHWKNKDLRMLKILQLMDSVEPWILDEVDSVGKELALFGKKLNRAKTNQLSKNSELITFIMTYIFSSKSMRLLNWLDENFPGLSFHYVMEARHHEDWEPGKLLLDRLKTIKSLQLMNLIFAPMRTRLITGLLDDDEEDDDDEEENEENNDD